MLSASPTAWILAGALVAALVAWWWSRRQKRGKRSARRPFAKKRPLAELRRELRCRVHDEAVVRRLVAKERERHPELSERAILERILRRLVRDRGR